MATGVRFRPNPRLQQFLRRLDPQTRDSVVSRSLREIAIEAESEAKLGQIVRGRGNAPPLPKRLSSRSGRLIDSIGSDFSGLPKRALIGSRVIYARVHELGLGPYPKRPFLAPAARKVISKLASRIFKHNLRKARRRR